MQALILAGGLGTRLRPLTINTPKPIVPIVNRPFLFFQLDLLWKAGITDVCLALNYQPNKIETVLKDFERPEINIRFVTEPEPLGTAGAYKFAANTEEPTIVLNGDIFTNLDLAKMIEFHRGKHASATIALKTVPNPEAYGLVETDAGNNIIRFIEKPSAETIASLVSHQINAGIYILEPEILDLIPVGEPTSFEYSVFPKLIASGTEFTAFDLAEAYWRDIGNSTSYLEAHLDYLSGKISGFDLPVSATADIAPIASVKNSLIGRNCKIEEGSSIINSVIGDGVTIGMNTLISDSVIWPESRIAAGLRLSRTVVGRNSDVAGYVADGSVLGDETRIPDNITHANA